MFQKEEPRQNEQVSARLPSHEIEKIDALVHEGYCLNTSDFVRMAVREKLQGIILAQARSPTNEEAKGEILTYLDQHGQAYGSNIALHLGLDIDLVFAVLKELQQDGEVT